MAVSDISSLEMVITYLLSRYFLSFLIIYLNVKWFVTDFDVFFIFFYFMKNLSLSLSLTHLYSYKT